MNSEKYKPTIGLEIHAELKTLSKMFCGCKNNPEEGNPNINICPICLGHPGTLPVLNKKAIESVLRVGLSLGGKLADFTEWDRKNYFYPDIPKGYQVSQFAYPLVSGGTLADVTIERIHLEEDTAQSTHDTDENSLVNFNRSGVPLMELVTTPTIHSAKTAVNFAKELQLLLRYLGAGDANMEKGEMRVEANISVSPTSSSSLGTKTEVKNLNSFRTVERAIDYEIKRQIDILESGEKIIQETRGWDESRNKTYSQRSKEGSHDYRYFPEPDIPKLKISELPEFSEDVLLKSLPELPWTKRERYKKDYGMTDKETAVFIESPSLANYFESTTALYSNDAKKIKLTINYLLTDLLGLLKKESLDLVSLDSIVSPDQFSELVNMAAQGDISSRGAKDLLGLMLKERGSSPHNLAEKHSLLQKSDASVLIPAIEKVIADNPKVVAEYKDGKTPSLQFLIGQSMKATKGAGNPEVVKNLLIEKIG